MCPPETAKAGAAFPNPALLSDIHQIPSANRETQWLHSAAEHCWTHTDAGQRQEEDPRCDEALNTLN